MEQIQKIKKLTKSLYPTGRAFKIPVGGFFEKLVDGLSQSEDRAYRDARLLLKSIIPDNDDFTEDDATSWERRLGLVSNTVVNLEDRKLAIKRKMNHPGNIKARQNYRFLERELRAAGFDVYVYENRFDDGMGGYETRSPEDILGSASTVQHGDFSHGTTQHGFGIIEKVVNYIEPEKDNFFDNGSSLRSTFFISSSVITTFASIDQTRKDEFRKLILSIKPVQTIGFLFVNYI